MVGPSWLRRGGIASVLLIALACGAPTVSPAPPSSVATATVEPVKTAGAPTPNETAVPANTTTPGSPAPVGGASDQQGLLLTEVGLAPSAGNPAFVEITNTTSAPMDMTGSTLSLGQNGLPLGLTLPVAAGARLLVLFDGLDSVAGTVMHTPSGLDLAPDRGLVTLVDRAAMVLDRVAWGYAEPNAVSAGSGGIVPVTFEAGATISRPPGATVPGPSDEWIVNAPADASPGEANPMPTVSVLLPISGAILEPTQADLFWYPVAGAMSYRVQVASEPTFASPAVDATVAEPQVSLAALAPGAYSWRVQAIGADGNASQFSEVSNVGLATAGIASSNSSAFDGAGARMHGAGLAADTPGRHLSVPVLAQHKDTAMLLLERNVETGAHPWDADHHALDPRDPADNKNCAIAMVAMISAFYGGNLSQDRIGYEVLQRRAGNPAGPEGDLVYGHGITGVEASEAFRFALGGVTESGLMTFDDMWNTIVSEIDAGRPVAGANSHHGFVVTGYEVTGGRRLISINDPWPGRTYKQDIDRSKMPASDFNLWLMPASPVVRHQEASVTTDSDADGVVDFDEIERFKTNQNDKDTDQDRLPDKLDIVTGVFDESYGYAKNPDPEGPGRDFDSDGIPTERDPDSDAGTCFDGDEDMNHDGHRNGSETWNFDVSDDSCGYRIVGRYRVDMGLVCLNTQPALVTDTIEFSLTPTDDGSFTVTDLKNSTNTFTPPTYLPGVTVTVDAPPEAFTITGGTVTVTDYTIDVVLASSSTVGTCTVTIPNEGQITVPGMTIDEPLGFAFDPTETFVDGKLTFEYPPWTWVVTKRGATGS